MFQHCQVDNFPVSAPTKELCDSLFQHIQQHLTQPLKLPGVLDMYNSLNITQRDRYIKISCKTYLKKILKTHGWLLDAHSPVKTPMQEDAAHARRGGGHLTDTEKSLLQQTMGFSFHQTIGELLFTAVTCCLDILYAIICLSNFGTNPAEIHYIVIKRVF